MRRSVVRTALILAVQAGSILAGIALADSTLTISLPPDARHFGPGPGQALAQANCTACHAADYVYTQPPLTKPQWIAEVRKMKASYGAPIPDDAVDALAAYLFAQNGTP